MIVKENPDRKKICSAKKFFPENFGKLTAKHMCWSLFNSEVKSVLQLSLKRNSGTGASLYEFCETFQSNVFYRTPLGNCFLTLIQNYEDSKHAL